MIAFIWLVVGYIVLSFDEDGQLVIAQMMPSPHDPVSFMWAMAFALFLILIWPYNLCLLIYKRLS